MRTSSASTRIAKLLAPILAPILAPLLAAMVLLVAPGLLTAQSPAGPRLSEAGRQALELLDSEDMAGAIAVLEAHLDAGDLGAVEQAILGTLYLEVGRPVEALAVLGPLADSEAADPAVLFNAGRAARELGRVEVAASYLERSLAIVPRSPAARELGLIRGGQGRTFEAYKLLRPWVDANPEDLEARIAAAACSLILGRPTEAQQLLEGVAESADPKVVLLRGQLLQQQGDVPGALAVFESLLADHPPEMERDILRLTADAYVNVGRSQDAVRILEGKVDGDLGTALLLAEAYYRSADVASAVSTLAPFAEPLLTAGDDPSDGPSAGQPGDAGEALGSGLRAQVVLDYGRFLVSAGRPEEALPYLELATELTPEQQLAWKNLGDALLGAGHREEAVTALKRFRELSIKDSERKQRVELAARDPVAKSLMEAGQAIKGGRQEEALTILRREAALSSTDPRPRLMEAHTLLTSGRAEEALDVVELALEAFPDNPDIVYQHGAVLLALDRVDEGVASLRRALAMAPGHTPALNDLAVVLMRRGELTEARMLLERALEVRPEDELAAENFRQLEAREAGGGGPGGG